MSIVAPSQRRLVWPVAIALTCSMLVALLLYLPTRTPTVEGPDSVAAPGVRQADWEVRVFPAGVAGGGKLTKATKDRVAAQRERVSTVIKDVYDALFLNPDRLKGVLARGFTRAAAAGAARAKIGLPAGAGEVHIKRRVARVGIHVRGVDRAAARVAVFGTAEVKGRPIRFEHVASLWLERSDGAWKVIGFDVVQGPQKARSPKKGDAATRSSMRGGKK